MTPEKQCAALAKAFPTVLRRRVGQAGYNYKNSTVGRILPCIDGDPLKDLNAIHEIEKLLKRDGPTPTQSQDYVFYLNTLACQDKCMKSCFSTTTAEASQRAECILRAIKAWED